MKIIINSREKEFNSAEIGYADVVALAFPGVELAKHDITVTYTRQVSPPFKDQGVISGVNKVRVTSGMRFNAAITHRS